MRFITLLSFLIVPPLFAQLHWDDPEQNLKAKPGDKEAVMKFHFVNAGQSAIKIVNVRTSCGCTTAALAKDNYAPSEAGDIEARFSFGSHTGRQEKTITVTTSDAPDRPTYLGVETDNPDIRFEVKPITPGKELEVSVTPNDTKRPQSGTLLIKTDYPPENPQTYYEYIRVQ
jgi:hypothetical protein